MAASATSVATAATASSLSQSEEDALKVAVFQRLHPRAYLERFLAENIRPDKRLCGGFRDVHVNVGEFFFFSLPWGKNNLLFDRSNIMFHR
jgi:exosome complex component RRP43